MMQIKLVFPRLICILILIVMQCALLNTAESVSLLYPTLSLRYAKPIVPTQVQSLIRFQQSDENANGIYASFWRQDLLSVTALTSTREVQDVSAIAFCGNANSCYGARYCVGTAPSSLGRSCAVSQNLAHLLWGSEDVLNQQIVFSLNGKEVVSTVTGVFNSSETILLYNAFESLEFYCIELEKVSKDTPKASTLAFVQSAGLPSPDTIVYGSQISGLAVLLVLLLPTVGCIAAVILTTHRFVLRHKINPYFYAFFLFFLASLALPYVLSVVPGWLIPNQWSDFSFWRALINAAIIRLDEWNAVCCTKDSLVKKLMLWIILLHNAMCWLCVFLAHISKRRFRIRR